MRILVILTGGTITMVRNEATGALRPADTDTFRAFVPELFTSSVQIDMLPFEPLIDSSDVNCQLWEKIARTIEKNYPKYDGFVVLHGTDTMAYTASALSFMLRHLTKPVIFTGSQLPIGVLRSDAKENLMTAVEIASEQDEQGRCRVQEVCIYFGSALLRATAPPRGTRSISPLSRAATTPRSPKRVCISSTEPTLSTTNPPTPACRW